jgi:hypothetical protein
MNHTGAVKLGVVTQEAQFLAPFSIMDQTNGIALRARVSDTRVEFFRDTVVNGGLSVTGPSQLQGVEASGVMAEQVVWVTGAGAPAQSTMFPGSLQLGKWRTRGSEADRYVLERLDDDGTTQTDGWVPVAAFTHDPNTNAAGLEVEGIRAQKLLVGPDPPVGFPAAAWIDGMLRATGNIETTARLRADTLAPFAGIVRVEGIGLIALSLSLYMHRK